MARKTLTFALLALMALTAHAQNGAWKQREYKNWQRLWQK